MSQQTLSKLKVYLKKFIDYETNTDEVFELATAYFSKFGYKLTEKEKKEFYDLCQQYHREE